MAKSADSRPMKREWSQGIYEISATKREALGALRITHEGRKFRYTKAGAVALVAAYPMISTAPIANHTGLTPAAAGSIGDTTIYLTLGGTAATEDYYQDGYVTVDSGVGIGHMYLIDSNPAQTSTTGTLTLHLAEPIRVAFTVAGSTLDVVNSPWNAVVVSTAVTDCVAGVTTIPVTALYYFWLQTGGPAPLITTNSEAHGTQLSAGGAVGIEITAWTDNILGPLFGTGVTSEPKMCLLKID